MHILRKECFPCNAKHQPNLLLPSILGCLNNFDAFEVVLDARSVGSDVEDDSVVEVHGSSVEDGLCFFMC